MKVLQGSILLLAMASCQLAVPRTELPAPYERSGVRVTVDGFYKQGFSVVGLSGTAENVSGKDLTMCSLSFDVVDSDGVKVGDAIATTQGLMAGQKWRFQALFTTPFATTFKGIYPGSVTALGTAEDMVADMLAKVGSTAPPTQTPLATTSRMAGVFCEQRLPNGDVLPRIDRIMPGSLAEQAGWQVGDLIIAVDGALVRTLTDVVLATQQGSRKKTYTLQRGEERIESSLTFP